MQKVRKAHASEADHFIVAELLQDVGLEFKAYIDGGIRASLNGEAKWEGYIASV